MICDRCNGTGQVPDEAPADHSCEWCEINVNHPSCPENTEPPCPHCGSEPTDTTLHTESCPTLGTCAECYVDVPQPWHPEPDFTRDWEGAEAWSRWLFEHFAEHHADFDGRPRSYSVGTDLVCP